MHTREGGSSIEWATQPMAHRESLTSIEVRTTLNVKLIFLNFLQRYRLRYRFLCPEPLSYFYVSKFLNVSTMKNIIAFITSTSEIQPCIH